VLNTNYADLSFLFTILPGEKTNPHLGTEYLAVVETDNSTPYFLNLHTRDVAHTLILGMTAVASPSSANSGRSEFQKRKCSWHYAPDLLDRTITSTLVVLQSPSWFRIMPRTPGALCFSI